MIKLIASDMDGTLLGSKMDISPENIAAIRYAESHGAQFVVATGRGYTEAVPALQEAGIKCPLIAVNGAQAFDKDGKELFTIQFTKETALAIMTELKNAHVYFEIATNHGIYSDSKHHRIENMATMLANHLPHLTFKMAVAMAAAQLDLLEINHVEDYESLLANPDLKILKFIAFSQSGKTVLGPLRAQLETLPDLIVTSSFPNNIEINHVNAQKGIAVKQIAEALNIPLREVMTIGDNFNDVSMLEIAGVSFAMENAEPGVKAIARYEAPHHTDSGVGKAIRRAIDENL
ncbi:Cof-type HAD-IIB family hydrolase [Vagococcus salmoninarum]|uniref:Cof-type HAD-IIB family hydrolase n=1 Tax=Vagococcus salmoninarum TaxID=2739 RepID=UPI0028D54B8B|nr:Cof-type HAD-IIB family hydrolase [Vagococcus salmoninarum]